MQRCSNALKYDKHNIVRLLGFLSCCFSLFGCVIDDPSYGPGESFEPAAGVICDRGKQVCFDRQGPDIRLTRQYFGEAAAERLRRRAADPRGGQDGVFVPQPGVRCDSSRQVCFDQQGPDVELTRQYFGDEASERLARQRPEHQGHQGHVLCEPAVQVCADRQGPDVNLTRQHFGEAAADRLVRELSHQGAVFEPRPGISCDRSQRICYDRQGADVQWTRLFFGEDASERLRRR